MANHCHPEVVSGILLADRTCLSCGNSLKRWGRQCQGGLSLDRFFDRLGNLVRSFVGEGAPRRSNRYSDYDPDMREAWEELDDYLNDRERPGTRDSMSSEEAAAREHLRQDYANLEVPFGAPFAEVKKQHKKLLSAYHPDHNARDPEQYRVANEITKKINASFQRIRAFEEQRGK